MKIETDWKTETDKIKKTVTETDKKSVTELSMGRPIHSNNKQQLLLFE